MTSTDDILTQIDHALEDGSVSYDAMRSRPATERPAEPTVWIAPAGMAINGDGWVRLEGVSDVEFIEEEPDGIDGRTSQAPPRDVEITVILSDQQLADTVEIFAALRRAAIESVRRSVEAAAHAIQQFSTAFDDSRWIDSNGDEIPAVPVVPFEDRTCARKRRRTDRPAWQSPYGPPHRRR